MPQIRGDGYDKLFSHLAHKSTRAPISQAFDGYPDILLRIRNSEEFETYPKPRQEKLRKTIGMLRFQKSKLHTGYTVDEIDDPWKALTVFCKRDCI